MFKIFFIFSTPVLIRHLWQLKTVVFLLWCLICAVPLNIVVKQHWAWGILGWEALQRIHDSAGTAELVWVKPILALFWTNGVTFQKTEQVNLWNFMIFSCLNLSTFYPLKYEYSWLCVLSANLSNFKLKTQSKKRYFFN